MNLRERIESFLRERRIRRLCREAIRLTKTDPTGARVAFRRMSIEIERRTPQQIERMERAQRLERRKQG